MCSHLSSSPNKDHEVQGTSGETASNLLLLPFSVQTLYDNEFQSRFQGETAQTMFERLSRLFEESDVNNFMFIQIYIVLLYRYYI